MPRSIRITAGDVSAMAELKDSAAADKIWEALPITGSGSTWGDEIYFGIPVDIDLENPQPTVELGDLGYWPPGSAFCIFFGPTPISSGDEIRPADAVEVFGKIAGDPTVFKGVRSGAKVVIDAKE